MTITVDTDLTEILTSKEIQEDLDEWNKTIQTFIDKRQSAIANVTKADGDGGGGDGRMRSEE